IVLVRHGQTAWNLGSQAGEHFRGQEDVPLNELGLAQARATAARVRDWPIQAVYGSPLRRAYNTAEIIAQAVGRIARPLPGLLDIHYGRWAGRPVEEVAREEPDLFRQWLEAPHTVRIPGGESLATVQARAMAALEEVRTRHPDGMVLLVGHQVVNRVILCTILGIGLEAFWRVGQETCCINLFHYRDGVPYVDLINDTCHLAHLAHGG
ncbi:MAG: histidine phosphatase family protein, partial [Anaerolineae bacterium]|nr:histidine phosphatase family protein [Anaerolineae bacterium]